MGAGSRLIAGTLQRHLDRAVIEQTILEGFFPLLAAEAERPAAQRPAIAEFGLPYVSEPAVTRHLMRFWNATARRWPNWSATRPGARPGALQRRRAHAGAHPARIIAPSPLVGPRRPHAPGCWRTGIRSGRGPGGGLLRPGQDRQRGAGGQRQPAQLLSGGGPRRRGRTTAPQALCLVERGLDEGSAIELSEQRFEVLTNQPVRFDLFSSSFRIATAWANWSPSTTASSPCRR